jgi:LacI family transcriptional regulator
MKIRIKDISRMAGVSEGTVDRVLHNRGEVAQETRNQVLAIIEKLGYTPNLVAKSLATKRHYRIAVLIPEAGKNNPYWEKPMIGINQGLEEIRNFNGEIDLHRFDLNKRETFIEEFNKILDSEPDGLIFSPIFSPASGNAAKSCEVKNIPYVFIDVNLENCNKLAYFGQDSVQSGYLAAKLMSYGLKDNANIVILKMVDREGTIHHLAKRELGFMKYFESDEMKKRVNISFLVVDLAQKNEIETVLKKNTGMISAANGIYVPNSRAYSIAKFLESTGIQGILLIGYDLIEPNLRYLEKGLIRFLISQKPEEQGYRSVTSLFYYLISNKKIDKMNYSPIDIIMKENIDYYKNLKG